VLNDFDTTTENQQLRGETGYERDKVPILSRQETKRESDEEFRRIVQKYAKAVPIEPSKPPAVVPNVASVVPNAATDVYYPPGTYYEPKSGVYYAPGTYYEPDPEPPAVVQKRKKRPVPPIPQEEEMQRFFKAIDSTRDRAIFRIMYHAGLRASEIGLLEMRDFIPRTDRLMITRLKGSNSGEHHLNRESARALKAWLKERGTAPGVIFGSKKGGPISRKRLDALVKQYAARAGWPARLRHCHTFKHACCTHLLSKGFNVEQVQDWVGHANIQNTMIYARVTNARRGQMGKALADWK
jgi:integrase